MASKSKPQIWIEYVSAKSIMATLGVLPRSWAVSVGFLIAAIGYRIFGKLRRVGLRSLEISYPEMDSQKRSDLLKRSFKSLGRTLGVVTGFQRITREQVRELIDIDFDDDFKEQFEKIRSEKRGYIVLTGHLGNWEMFALAYSVFFEPSNLLSRKMDNPKIDAMVESMRSSFGNRQIDKINSAGPILRILRSGGNVGILADVNTHPKEGVFVPFFGVEACTTAGVALLAQRANALIVPLFAVWNEEKGRYSMVNEKIIEPANTGDREADIRTTTAEFTAALERMIRRYPDQWVWIHRRWKTRRPGEPDLY
jgi:Kdo2-lipid IVA lauroyltransferase/acyltransferase